MTYQEFLHIMNTNCWEILDRPNVGDWNVEKKGNSYSVNGGIRTYQKDQIRLSIRENGVRKAYICDNLEQVYTLFKNKFII